MTIAFLLVTCCLEPSRADVLKQVVDNISTHMPELQNIITVFDNASTEPGTRELLTSKFKHVYAANTNIGYWSAIDWWLTQLQHEPPKYTYIIESDMIHYAFDKIWLAAQFLRDHADVGAVRLHEYSVELKHLYNKDKPVNGSRTNIWQSHTNKVTGSPIVLSSESFGGIHTANFLTQLPALNRYRTMRRVFDELSKVPAFSEVDFQRLYHNEFPLNAILDGGIFHCNPGAFGAAAVTSSWTSSQELARIGYHATRQGTIISPLKYTVSRVL